jgi:release factor glutamine methyltransferase
MSAPPSVGQALTLATRAGVERQDAQHLLCEVLGWPRSRLFSHDDTLLSPDQADSYAALCQRAAAGEPLAYLLGVQAFHGLELQVSSAVLVPRPDTAVLVDWAVDLLAHTLLTTAAPQVVDLGTGSGAVALAIKHACPAAQLTAVDASADALQVAQANSDRLQLPVRCVHSDWWQALAGQRFDVIVSNPPYIRGDDPHLAALTHEPRLALTPEGDGLGAYRTILHAVATHLRPGGWVVFEHGWDQADAVCALLTQAGLTQVGSRCDLAGRARCSGGQLPA